MLIVNQSLTLQAQALKMVVLIPFFCILGAQKLNRLELEAACEEFSNIIVTCPEYTVFKGTLSSGVEVAVVSTAVKSSGDWSKASEMCFRKKVHFCMLCILK